MNSEDPTTYIFAAALLAFCCGFVASALMAARTVRRANKDAWKEASDYYRNLYRTERSGDA